MREGETAALATMQVTLDRVGEAQGPNYQAFQAHFTVREKSLFGADSVRNLDSERRFFPVSRNQTTEAGIGTSLLGNSYIAIGDQQSGPRGPGLVVRIYRHPLVGWIWFGGLMMAMGGAASLADRRFRIGAPLRAAVPMPAPRLAPAE
jgi:cytochrome c-type biogenesis protein CcmF